ncbi:MAG: hypothetical protein ACE5I1_12820 [bacterium]
MKAYRVFLSIIALVLLNLAACNVSVNRSIEIDDGETVSSSLNTVNGNILIGNECVVKGSSRTVNGRIEVGRNSEVDELQCVNGSIRLGKEVHVLGDIETVNGSVSCDPGVKIDGEINSINGSVDLENTTVRRDLTTYNGSITLLDESIIDGDIVIEENKGSSSHRRRLKIRITENSVVKGDIDVRDDDIEVIVYLSKGGKVNGKIKNAEVVEE